MLEVPNDYKTAGIFSIVAGILNLMMAGILMLTWISTIFLSPVACFYVIPGCYALVEIAVGVMVMQGKPMPQAKTLAIVGIVMSVLNCQWIGILMESLAVVWHGKPEVQEWLEQQAI